MAMFESVDAGFSYIESFVNLERQRRPREYRLERMRFLLDRFDHPERGIKFIHVAGSKGKGSTSTFIANILEQAGIPTGLFTKPHVVSYRERITRSGVEFPDDFYLSLIHEIRDGVDAIREQFADPEMIPTTFELLTLMGFLAFKRKGFEWVVIETGIGGRLDATNVILPQASVITPIELEHTDLLGTTIPQIASEKAGIIKPSVPVFVSRQPADAFEVFVARARETGSKLVSLAQELATLDAQPSISGTSVAMSFSDGLKLSTRLRLIGTVQAENAALAALVVSRLFPDVRPIDIERGLALTYLPGRMEMIRSDPPVMLDGAHTEVSARKVLATFHSLYPAGDGILVFGAVDGKNYAAMVEILAPAFRDIIVTTPGFFKSSHPEEVYRLVRTHNERALLVTSPREAILQAVALAGSGSSSRPVLVTGSFYLVGETRKELVAPRREAVGSETVT